MRSIRALMQYLQFEGGSALELLDVNVQELPVPEDRNHQLRLMSDLNVLQGLQDKFSRIGRGGDFESLVRAIRDRINGEEETSSSPFEFHFAD